MYILYCYLTYTVLSISGILKKKPLFCFYYLLFNYLFFILILNIHVMRLSHTHLPIFLFQIINNDKKSLLISHFVLSSSLATWHTLEASTKTNASSFMDFPLTTLLSQLLPYILSNSNFYNSTQIHTIYNIYYQIYYLFRKNW